MGEPSKVLLLEKVIEIIKRNNLIENVNATGQYTKYLLQKPFRSLTSTAIYRSNGQILTLRGFIAEWPERLVKTLPQSN